ncbi:MAG: hypothetical protein GXP44_01165 [bacterium]|nr:hypothetical protein [bacterium]
MGKGERKTLVLLDAHAILHRAFHALPNFTSPKGEPTGALYGFTAFLLKVIRELKPDYIAACYDLPEPTFRKIAYEQYKGKRPKMDDTLAKQINRSRDILDVFKIPVYAEPGFEADDILGTIVENLKSQISPRPTSPCEAKAGGNLKIIVASGDLDTLQLVKDDDVVVYTLSKGIKEAVIYNEDKVKERYGFEPKLLPDFKGLKGDPSDNIIGVPGIGDKTGGELIQKFGTIENIYKILKEDKSVLEKAGIKPRTIKLLEENEEEAMFSKGLAEIRRDAPIKFSLKDCEWKKQFDIEKARTLFGEFGFRSLIARLENNTGNSSSERADELPRENGGDDGETEKTGEEELFERFKGTVPEKLFKEVELPLSKILAEMQDRGILLDTPYLAKLSKEYHKELDRLEKKIWSLAGEEFNVNSSQQLGKILFDGLKLNAKGLRKTSGGARSTNIAVLEKLKDLHPIIKEIISYRELSKLVSTYVDALPKLADENGRLHTTFDQAGTATGRISSKNPNLQNIPKRTELGRKIRRAFVADKGFKLVAFDYSQIELRIAAILSKDPKMKKVFTEGGDIHTAVACEVFNVEPDKVTDEMRRRAKVINFGIIYGMGINALRANLGCSREEARVFYDEYFKGFEGMAAYIERAKESAHKKGYTETLLGRKRFFPEINSPIEYIRKEAERMAVNAPIQGTAADFIKLAMVRADKALKESGLKDRAFMLLQIHDELLFEISDEAVGEAVPVIVKAMEGVYEGDIPIKTNVSVGKNWEDMVEYKK